MRRHRIAGDLGSACSKGDGVVGAIAGSASLRTYIRSLERDYHQAEDLEQEVALVLTERLRRGGGIQDAAAFARGIARRAFLANRRARIRGAQTLVGREIQLKLVKGSMTATVKGVSDAGLAVLTKFTINNQTGERALDLKPDDKKAAELLTEVRGHIGPLTLLGADNGANFWQPSGGRSFAAVAPGDLLLFKLHSPDNFVVGGGVFAHHTRIPISLEWKAFGVANGASSFEEMHARVVNYVRKREAGVNHEIGCILLKKPFFLPEDRWVPQPADWSRNIVQGKTYDLTVGHGKILWDAIRERLAEPVSESIVDANRIVEEPPRYGAPTVVLPRLGQGTFRVMVTEAYDRRCAITRERTLPVLEAAHIKPYAKGGTHPRAMRAHRFPPPCGLLHGYVVSAVCSSRSIEVGVEGALEVSHEARIHDARLSGMGLGDGRRTRVPVWVRRHRFPRPRTVPARR